MKAKRNPTLAATIFAVVEEFAQSRGVSDTDVIMGLASATVLAVSKLCKTRAERKEAFATLLGNTFPMLAAAADETLGDGELVGPASPLKEGRH